MPRHHDVKIFLIGEQAFVEISKNYMLCIGSKTEVDEATPAQLAAIITSAVALSRFRDNEKGFTVH